MAFDPDSYLAQKQSPSQVGGFDPDAYLAGKQLGSPAAEKKSLIDMGPIEFAIAAARGLDSVTGAPTRAAIGAAQDGKNPLSAFASQFAEDPDRAPTGKQIAQKAGVSERPVYDTSDENFDQLMMTDPTIARDLGALRGITRSGAAGVAIDVAADPTTFIPVGKVAKGAAKAGDALQGAKVVTGKGLKGLAETSAFKSSGAMLKDFRVANDKGKVNQLGRYMLDNGLEAFDDVESIAKKFESRAETAGKALDDVYSKAGEKFKTILDKVGFDPKRDKAEILAAARSELGNTVGSNEAVKSLSKYLDEVSARFGDKPAAQAASAYKKAVSEYLPKYRQFIRDKAEYKAVMGKAGEDLNQPTLRGVVDDGQRTGSKLTRVELNGKSPEAMRAAPGAPMQTQMRLPDLPTGESETARLFADETTPFWETVQNRGSRTGDLLAESAQRDFLNQNTAEQISLFGKQGEIDGLGLTPRTYVDVAQPTVVTKSGQGKMVFAPSEPIRPVRPGDVRNPMSPRATNDVKSSIDDTIRYSRNPLAPEPAKEKAFYAARKKIAAKVDEAIESLGGDELLEQLKTQNREYGSAKTIANISQDRVSRDSANQMFSLTDKIAGTGAGSAMLTMAGGANAIAAGLATATGSKLVRKYGASTVAVAADRVSKYLLKAKPMQELAQKSPQEFQAVVLNFTRRTLERVEPARAVADKTGPSELDSDSSRSSNFQDREAQSEPAPKKGREKWMDDGLKKLESHGDGDVSKLKDELMKSAKGKRLLIAASDLKPGSKAMDHVLKQIESEFGKGRK